MEESQKSYRQIFKATSLFGGVQLFTIIITIIRTKFIAVLLGPTGMGIAGLLTSTRDLVGSLTDLGLSISAVKNVAEAHASGERDTIGTVVGVLRRLVWITGSLGAIVMMVLSSWLSQVTFGNRDYKLAFIWISVTLLLNQIGSGQRVLLRGTNQLKYLAKASLLGSLLGLFISVPIYYFFGIDGIVPAIIISSIASLILTWHFSSKVELARVKITREKIITHGRGMITMGFMLSLHGLITMGTSYLIRIYISNVGGVDQVGLFTAGFAIVNTYVGMIFTAMSVDYFPRLSAVAYDNNKTSLLINQQSEIAVLILAPILSAFIVFIQYVVVLLYATKFMPVNNMIQWAALGMYFKTVSWAIGYILLAKGASNVFFWNELIAETYLLGFNILGYKLAGLDGLGISFLVGYIIYLTQVYFLARFKYGFFFQHDFFKLFTKQLVLGLACFIIIRFLPTPWSYLAGSILILISTTLSLVELDKRLDLRAIWINIKDRF